MKQLFLILLCITSISQAQNINIGIRDSIYSKTMEDTRPFSVYFPPSYYTYPNQKYPVLYILDGDYNFQYVTGLIELQSSISENIPEMIVIGISGKDSKTYMKNCIPEESDSKLEGNANKVFKFINTELVPFIEKKYKANNYKILSGHSKGGLFTINSALHEPGAFNHYIAISPALWYENNSINIIAKNILNTNKDFKTNVYISLANEKGMGVNSFLKVATTSIFTNPFMVYALGILGFILSIFLYQKLKANSKLKRLILPILTFTTNLLFCGYLLYLYYPTNTYFKFHKFPQENHNSVGAPTYKWALNDIFKNWKNSKMYFDSPSELENYTKKTKEYYGNTFNLTSGALANTVKYILKDNQKALEEIKPIIKFNYPESVSYYYALLSDNAVDKKEYKLAKKALQQSLENDSMYYKSYYKLALIAQKQQEQQLADSLLKKSRRIAIKQNVRQWELNELILD